MGVSPKALAESELYTKFSPEFKDSSDYKEAVGMFEGCGLEPLEFDSVVVGGAVGAELDDQLVVKFERFDFVVVIAGLGVGKHDAATCMVNAMQKQNGEEEKAEVVKEDGKDVVKFEKGRAYLINDNLVAITSTAWETKVGELIDGKGNSAAGNSKKELLAKVDHKQPMWFVANVNFTSMALMPAAVPIPAGTWDISTLSGTVDLGKGIALELVAGFRNEDEAKVFADDAQTKFDIGWSGRAGAELDTRAGVAALAPPGARGRGRERQDRGFGQRREARRVRHRG